MKNPSIKNNFIYSMFFQVFSVVVPFITMPYLSRVLGVEGIGIRSYTDSVQTYFSMFAALGTSTYGAREIAQHRRDKNSYTRLFWEIELMTVVTTTVCLLAWAILIFASKKYTIYYAILTLNLVASLFDISWFFNGLEQFGWVVAKNTVFKIIGIFCIFIFVREKSDLTVYFFIQSGSIVLANLSMWSYLPKVLEKFPKENIRIIYHLKRTIVYFIPNIASSVYLVLDKVILEALTKNIVENGYYAQAEKIISICKSLVFIALNSVVGVRISFLFSENKIEEIHQRINYSMNYIMFMGFGCMFGIQGIAANFVPLFFGDEYGKVVFLLYFFCPIIIPTAISSCMNSQYFTPIGRRTECTKYILVGAVINVLLNFGLIPKYASYGAVCASVIAECVIAILFIYHSKNYMTFALLWKIGTKKLLSGIIMLIAVIVIGKIQLMPTIMVLAFQIFFGISSYLISLILMRDVWTVNFINSVLDLCTSKIDIFINWKKSQS